MEKSELTALHPKCSSCKYYTEYSRRDTRFEFIEVDVPVAYCDLHEFDVDGADTFYCASHYPFGKKQL